MRAIRRDVWYDKDGVFRRDADRRAARRMIAEKAPAAAFLRGAEAPGNGRADAGKRTDAHRDIYG